MGNFGTLLAKMAELKEYWSQDVSSRPFQLYLSARLTRSCLHFLNSSSHSRYIQSSLGFIDQSCQNKERNYLNRNNIMANQLVPDQFPIISFHFIIHTFLPQSFRKTGSDPEPRKYVFCDCTTVNCLTIFGTVFFRSAHRSVTSTALQKSLKNL